MEPRRRTPLVTMKLDEEARAVGAGLRVFAVVLEANGISGTGAQARAAVP